MSKSRKPAGVPGKIKKAPSSVVRAARARFKSEIVDRAEDVDPFGELHWLSMATGFYIACGLSPDQAFMYGDRDVTAAAIASEL